MPQLATAPPPAAPATTLPMRSAPTSGGSAVIAAYAITIFTSAFLLFQVQPLISNYILPWFGGSPAVWTAAMLFFQVVLFGGYLYAHLTSTYLKPRGQFALHLVLLAVAAALALYTQISPSPALKPTGSEHESPLFQILLVLGASVGVPYFALSSTGPLLQKWFSDAFAGASPYRLFALSNVGSLLALLSYPFFFEVHWDSRQQASMWSMGFVAFSLCCTFCAWWTYRARQAHAVQLARTPAKQNTDSDQPATWWLRAAWIGLPALASVMFLAVTNEVCQNVATVPLLWIVPLSFYLISFIVAFDHPRWYSRPLCAAGAMLLLVYVSNYYTITNWFSAVATGLLGRPEASAIDFDTVLLQFSAYFLALLLVCLVCHCELAALKPGPKHLTFYFLSMSFGGALGGIFVNLIAPEIFNTFFEMPLAFLAATAIAGWLLYTWATKHRPTAIDLVVAVSVLAFAVITYGQIIRPELVSSNANTLTIHRDRSFFGLVSVQHRSRNEPEYTNFAFKSGSVPHGKEFADPARRGDTRLAYWGPDTGCRVTLEYKIAKEPNCHIGVVGLGIGTIAAFAKETDRLRFYEINPQVTHIAKTYFHFLSDCKAPYEIIHGDARLKLEEELAATGGHQFDVLCLDAFSGDAVPTHLLTTEAFATYKKHLNPDGIIVCNITNSYLDLWPVIKGMGDEHGLKTARIYRPRVENSLIERTYFAMLTNDEAFLGPTMTAVRERLKAELPDAGSPGSIPEVLIAMPANFQKIRHIPLWTDRYHNLFQVLR